MSANDKPDLSNTIASVEWNVSYAGHARMC